MSDVVVSGTFRDEPSLKRAMEALVHSGVALSDMSYASAPPVSGKTFDFRSHTRAAAGLAAGLILGAVIGALFIGWRFEASVFSRTGELLYAGHWLAALLGAVPGAAIGGILGWFAGHRIPVFEADLIEKSHQENPILLGVAVDENRAIGLDALLRAEGATLVVTLDKKFQNEVGL